MSIPASIVPDAPPRGQRIGAIEKLGRNAMRTLAGVQGRVWLGKARVDSAAEHAAIRKLIDARGDAIRAEIWRHEDAAHAAICRGARGEAISELRAAQALRDLYEECDAAEDSHDDGVTDDLAQARPHLKACAVTIAAMLSAAGG